MGKVVMPKNSADEKEIRAALKIYYNANDWVKNDDFKDELKKVIGGDQYSSSYTKKVQMLSYFGFTIWEDFTKSQSRRRITNSGKRFYLAWDSDNKDALLEELMYSLEHTIFGRDNCGCSDSDSDVEVPSAFIRTSLEMGYLFYSEFAFLLWKMEDCGMNYTDALRELKQARSQGNMVLADGAEKYRDAKPIMMLIHWGFLAQDGKVGGNTKVVVSENVLSRFENRLRNLKIYNVDKDLAIEEVETAQINPDDQKAKFKAWLSSQKKANGKPYSTNTISSYITNMSRGYTEFEKFNGYNSVFQIQDADSLNEYTGYLFNKPNFDEFNDRAGNKACSCGLAKYSEFLQEDIELPEIQFNTGFESVFARNRILFGAPGTGKSYTLNGERKELLYRDRNFDEDNNDLTAYGMYERVTFHPDYSYANFVGTYKPVPCKDGKGEDTITYEYVPGPFMRVYVEALKNSRTKDIKPFLLIVEEINRANVAAVFGDIFQLLDRGENEVSEYPIQASEDIKKYLAKELGGNSEKYTKIKLPDNMFIWSTMNSADQGVFPMDTAFKRRWDFTYLGIDDSEKDLIGRTVVLGEGHTKHQIEWNKLRKAINKFLAKNRINEDKQLGPYFIPKRIVIPASGNEIDREAFISTFKNKVIMYLFEDAAKQKRSALFEGCFDNSNRYSEICKKFDIKGIKVFNGEIQNATEPTDLSIISENEEITAKENDE